MSYISIFFAISQIDNNQKKILIKVLIASALIISVYSIYQYFWGYPSTLNYLKKINSGFLQASSYAKDILVDKRAIGTFPSPNILGGYLIIAFFLSLTFAQLRKLPSLACAILIAIALILTKSLGTWFSLTSTIAVLLIISYKESKKYRQLIIISCVFIFSALIFIIINRWERLTNLSNPQNSITQRVSYWRTAIGAIKGHPFLGAGPGNFQELFLKYKIGFSTNTRYAHNIFLQMWAETGVFGFIGMLILIYSFISKSILKSKYIFLAGLAFILHNLIDITYFVPETGFFFWILLALAAAS